MNHFLLPARQLFAGIAIMSACALAGAQSLPLACTKGSFYQLNTPTTTTTEFFRIDPSTSPYTRNLVYTITGSSLNGLAYNPQDGYMYAVNNSTTAANFKLFRLGATDAGISAPITGATGISATRNSGSFDAHGNMFIVDGAAPQKLYRITGAASMQPVASQITLAADTSPPSGFTGFPTAYVTDVVYSPAESNADLVVLYGTRGPESGSVYLYRIAIANPSSASPGPAQVSRRVASGLPTNILYGSAYFDASGQLYVSDNANKFYKYDPVTFRFTLTSTGTGTTLTNTDGTSCIALPQLDVVKQGATPAMAGNAYTFDVPYTVTVGNTGTVTAPRVQVSENLRQTFWTNSPSIAIATAPTVSNGSCTTNPAFDGVNQFALLSGNDSLAAGASCTISFVVRVGYADVSAVPTASQKNTVFASTTDTTAANPGPSWPVGFDDTTVPVNPPGLLGDDRSTDGGSLPSVPNGDVPKPTEVVFPPPTAPLQADMTVAISGVPNTVNPGSAVSGQIVCTNSGPDAATNATCGATAVDSDGNAVSVLVSNCAPVPPAALPAGSAMTCQISYTAPNATNASGRPITGVSLTATTNATNDSNPANNSATHLATLATGGGPGDPGGPGGTDGISSVPSLSQWSIAILTLLLGMLTIAGRRVRIL
ncbi:IPTL-CTERM sorting domain-containing protein [Diaphorobacter aerolatus]|uniref:IPTL-CTERM sorting domain-containing protein n=1 Tax=Diaphorobacter aerolatus TaxID=1288495 RepID=A0A7H0GI18_9BURK|nr:IPTL-CTERM sorting domain-containing protein [Diaphorobacter aerolatus]QNP47934.1 IPTL-CTERM sorting domain-containing protein [Diaphorobacter aerolatus]